jgi:hypothetical protein
MEAMAKACHQLLDYVATHPNAGICYLASDMILAVHANASYLSKHNACSQVSAPHQQSQKRIQQRCHSDLASIIKHVMSLALEAELAAIYYGCKIAVPIQTALD